MATVKMGNVCIPMHLDAFALSPSCCDGESKIAPYAQPNYTALRLESNLIQHDVVDHVDFHTSSPASANPRLADIGISASNNIKYNRIGIHLHWSLPRFYRAAAASGRKVQTGAKDPSDPTNPTFRAIPNRWLVTRHLKNHQQAGVLPEFQSWVVESDVVRRITTIPDDVDLECDVAPFVSYQGDAGDANALKLQSEVFLGQKFDLVGYNGNGAQEHMPVLTVMNSSNVYFPDYALHNTNVLSVVDNFAYKATSSDTDFKYLAEAQCDYFVIGWHNDPKDDPLNQAEQTDFVSRLSNLMLQLDSNNTAYGSLPDRTRCLIFGAIYDVKYNVAEKPHSLADDSALKFTSEVKMEPLSVGTTPLDGILTFLEAHKADGDDFFGTGGTTLASDILQISQLLYATADQYDSRVQAQDLIAQQNFSKAAGGLKWTFAKPPAPGGAPAIPSDSETNFLLRINEAQDKLDASTLKLQGLRWELFAEWWKYVSEYIPPKNQTARQKQYRDIVLSIIGVIGSLSSTIDSLNTTIGDLQNKVNVKSAAKDPYYTRTDPTLCIAGLDSGWPQDFLDNLTVQMDSELTTNPSAVIPIFTNSSNPVPTDSGLQNTAMKLLAQCLKNADTENGKNGPAKTTGFQNWGNSNPFVPLFIEWESMYYHIEKEKWDVQLRPSPVGHAHSQVRYVPNVELSDDPSNHLDFRALSGRIPVLPQPVFSLENVVLSVINNASHSPDMTLTPDQVADLKNNIRQIKFISAPLSGLTNHLLTRCEGAHVKPNVRVQGQKTVPLGAAAAASAIIGIDSAALELIGAESALTPYGTLMPFPTDQYPKSPFKGVTHGQMLFTKLNIIDKFGQAICVPAPKPRRRIQPVPPESNIYPCLSDYLAPDVINGRLNTVFPTAGSVVPGSWPLCQYLQLTPSINQDSRLNASFVMRDTLPDGTFSMWREASEYDRPIWGWIIINYADSGLQFFQQDGTFYAEVRKGGVHGSNISPMWLPYDPPALEPKDAAAAQLAALLAQFDPKVDSDGSYLQSFFDMINGSIKNMPFPPSDYSAYANSIVGKPLALVNAGWSIEMAAPAIKPQNTLGKTSSNPQADLESYTFPLKIGDYERSYDGVVGYYLSSNSVTPTTDWSTLYTYFVPKPTNKVKDLATTSLFPKLNPYYLDPDSTPDMTKATAAKYTVTTLIIDPYTPLHAYSPVLPTKALALPPWTIQAALQKMHAFFHLGPCLLSQDVPPTATEARSGAPVVKLPVTGQKGRWTWLQPYSVEGPGLEPTYVEMPVEEDLAQAKFEKAPYTFLEGYLQLMGSLASK